MGLVTQVNAELARREIQKRQKVEREQLASTLSDAEKEIERLQRALQRVDFEAEKKETRNANRFDRKDAEIATLNLITHKVTPSRRIFLSIDSAH